MTTIPLIRKAEELDKPDFVVAIFGKYRVKEDSKYDYKTESYIGEEVWYVQEFLAHGKYWSTVGHSGYDCFLSVESAIKVANGLANVAGYTYKSRGYENTFYRNE
jgi:hypothetical protein